MTIRQVAQQAMNENGQKIFHAAKQGEEEVSVASLARWKEQVRGLVRAEQSNGEVLPAAFCENEEARRREFNRRPTVGAEDACPGELSG